MPTVTPATVRDSLDDKVDCLKRAPGCCGTFFSQLGKGVMRNKYGILAFLVSMFIMYILPSLPIAGDLIYCTFDDSLFNVVYVLLFFFIFLQAYALLTTVVYYVISIGNHITPWNIRWHTWQGASEEQCGKCGNFLARNAKFILAIVGISIFSFYLSLALFSPTPCSLQVGEEYPFTPVAAQKVEKDILEFVTENHEKLPQRPALRGQHAKTIACVSGTFTVDPSIPPSHAVGIFAPGAPKTYPAWIRYSHSAPDFTPDGFIGPKGMAIKLLNVPGTSLLEDEPHTQDFVLLSSPIFFAPDPSSYGGFIRAFVTNQVPAWFLKHINSASAWKTVFSLAKIVIRSSKLRNLLNWDWFSTTPYSFGSNNPVKYMVKPCDSSGSQFDSADTKAYNFLRDAMQDQLDKLDGCFNFYVQFQEQACREPLEDPTIEWHTEPRLVGKLVIPKQQFKTKERMQYCDEMAFNPWHSLPEHKPLGGVNHQRLEIYKKTALMRSRWNNFTLSAPVANPKLKTPPTPLTDADYNRTKISAGNTVDFQFRPYAGFELGSYPYPDGLPGHIANLVKDSSFTTEKTLRVFRSALNGVNNQLQEMFTADFDLIKRPNDYTYLFHDPTMRSRIPWVANDNIWEKDSVFASQWIRGPNPMTIKRAIDGKFPPEFARNLTPKDIKFLNDEVLPEGHNVLDLLKQGRILYADYKILDNVPIPPELVSENIVRYPTLIVFYVKRDGRASELMPLAIQLEQWKDSDCPSLPKGKTVNKTWEGPWACDPSLLPKETIYFPPRRLVRQAHDRDDYIEWRKWLFARFHAASSDAQVHEMVTHLGLTHLLLEPIIISTYRQFDKNHTLFKLLLPHMRQTIAINELGRRTLLNKGGFFDSITALGKDGTLGLIAESYKTYNYMEAVFPRNMQARGFSNHTLENPGGEDDPVPGFLYRDYGYMIWDCLEKYVRTVVEAQYTDATLAQDADVQRWAEEIANPNEANVRGFPTSFKDTDSLIAAITHFIFTASAQHSCVNFGQFDFYGFIPNKPLRMTRPMPSAEDLEKEGLSWEYIMEALPNAEVTLKTLTITNILSMKPAHVLEIVHSPELFFGTLMKNALSLVDSTWRPRYEDPWQVLMRDLKVRSEEMKARNALNGYHYDYLYYDEIAMSISI